MKLNQLSLALLLAAAASPVLAAPPADHATINYQRCDKEYGSWGLHIWQRGGAAAQGVTWGAPLAPTGKNDFGVFWNVKATDFSNGGEINYIIHKGETKEQGGRDMKIDAAAGKEIWVLQGDRKTYNSLDEAQAARLKSPCK